jgi:hypothetical protein
MDYLQDPNNVAARRSSGGERNRWRDQGVEPIDMYTPDELAWRREVAAKSESLGPAVGLLVMEQSVEE